MKFGADYYPEQWTEKDWDEDLVLMKNMGLEMVRMAEFAWAMLEPKEGKFDFSFFDNIIDKCEKIGMKVILGTPTATFPPWLYKKYPSIVQRSKSGIERVIGTRRQASFCSKEYILAVERIVTEMAKHYGNNPTVIGWQIDNEPGHEGSDLDYSENSLKQFRKWLKDKYKSIKNLNDAWGNVFWGTLYSNFDEIPLPGEHIASGFNPSMIQDFYRFNSDMLVLFIQFQANLLRKFTQNQFITTNLFPSPFLAVTDMEAIAKTLDFVSWDNYPVWGHQTEPFPHQFIAGTHQFIRGLKDKNFTIMEQISGFQGHDLLGYLPAPGQLSLWLIQAILHGAENIVFFRYRTARFGQEQLCYGILDHNKSITSRYIELKKTIQEIKEIAIDIHSIEQTANIAFIHDIDNVRNLKHQPISEGLKFTPAPFANVGYDIEFFSWFAALNTLNVSAHVVPSNFENLERYKVLVLPIYFMYEEKLVERLEKFVSNGGTLILGYRSGIKDKRGWMVDDVVPGPFKFLAGLEVKEFESIGLGEVKIRKGIFSLTGSKISEILEPTTAKVLAKYSDSKKFYKGKAAITVNQYLKGNVYYIGTSLKPDSLAKFFMYILRKEKISFQFWGKDVEIIDRKGKSADYKIILNHSLKTKFYRFHKLAPFSYKIIKKLKG